MRNLGKVVLVVLLSFGVSFGAGVKATVDTVEVVRGNPVTLRIKATGGSASFPKILMVGDASVRGRSTSSSQNWSLVNSAIKNESSTTKTIQFMPEKDMTIPSYTVTISGQEYKTDPINIKVVKSSASSTSSNTLFALKMKSSKLKVRVGESFMVTVYFSLRSNVRLAQDVQYTAPSLSEFVVAQGEEQGAYIKGNYQVQEIRYIATAQEEGNLTISPAQVKVGVPDRSKRDIFGMTFGTKWYQTASNNLKVEVLPQAVDSDLIGQFLLESTIDNKEIKVNKPVNLTVKIEGKGNLEGFEFPKYEIDGVTVYSDEAKIDTKVVDGELYSIYSKSFAFISDTDFHIPERIFTMYDTKEEVLKELKVDASDISIKVSKNTGTATSNTHGVVQTSEPLNIETKEVIVEKTVEVEFVSWWMLVLAFISGMWVMYGARFIPTKKKKPYKESEALKILYGHMGEDVAIEEMVRKLYAKKNGDKSVEIDKKKLKILVERFN